ncbi:MAG: carboxypeptidase regulatory-like domain-containing protein [Phycisphaerae bacterium]|nr:carboxypeptidase regulatory-like domain-containing protein [Phycisphaerae bacterium]
MDTKESLTELARDAESVDRQLERAAGAPQRCLETLADRCEARAKRYAAVAQRLADIADTMETQNPQVNALRSRADFDREASSVIRNHLKRAERQPSIAADAGYVLGRVLDPNGKVMPQLRIRLVPRVSPESGGPAPTVSDELGDFRLRVAKSECCDDDGQAREYQVTVEDSRGTLMYTDPQVLVLNPGAAHYVEVVFGSGSSGEPGEESGQPVSPKPSKPALNSTPTTTRPPRKTKRKRRPQKPA